MRDNIRCAVCGKFSSEHGDGSKYPRTTCKLCYDFRINKNKELKIEENKKKGKLKTKKKTIKENIKSKKRSRKRST